MSIYGDGEGGEGLTEAPAPAAAAMGGGGGMDAGAAKGGGSNPLQDILGKFKALPEQTQKLVLGGVFFIVVVAVWISAGIWPFSSGDGGPSTIFASDLPPHGNFVVIDTPMSWTDGQKYCFTNHAGLASIHTPEDQRNAIDACKEAPVTTAGNPMGCWIGMNDDYLESAFRWSDGTPNDFRAFQPGEPNDYGRKHDEWGKNNLGTDTNGVGRTAANGEGYVVMRMSDTSKQGAWNDDPNDGKAGHATSDAEKGTHNREFGYYPMCQIAKPVGLEGDKSWYVPTARRTPDNKFTVIPMQQSWSEARSFCQSNGYADLASIHNVEEHASIVNVCATVANRDGHVGEAQGCWIGMTDRPAAGTNAAEGNWRWSDGSAVDFLAWTPGEPNNWRVAGSVSGGSAYNAGYEGGSVNMGEDVVAVTFAVAKYPGGWNDEHELGKAGLSTEAGVSDGSCFGCSTKARGFYTVCESVVPPATLTGAQHVAEWREPTPAHSSEVPFPKYIAIPTALSWTEARQQCQSSQFGHDQAQNLHPLWQQAAQYRTVDLASIHNAADQAAAFQACQEIVCPNGICATSTSHGDLMSNGLPHGCWIGMNDEAIEGDFVWSDNTPVNFLHFNPGEPNDWGRATGRGMGSHQGENYVEMDLRPGRSPPGGENENNGGTDANPMVPENQGWNDEHLEGVGAHDTLGTGSVGHDVGCFGCQGTYGMYFLCETAQTQQAPVSPYTNLPECTPHAGAVPHARGSCWKAPYCPTSQLAGPTTPGQPATTLDDNVVCGMPHEAMELAEYPTTCMCPTGCSDAPTNPYGR